MKISPDLKVIRWVRTLPGLAGFGGNIASSDQGTTAWANLFSGHSRWASVPLDYDSPCTGCIGGQFAAAISGDGAPAWARPGAGLVLGMAPNGSAAWTAAFTTGASIEVLSPDGRTGWSHRIDGPVTPRSIALGATNGIFVTGSYLDAVDWGPATTRAIGRDSVFLLGLSLDGSR